MKKSRKQRRLTRSGKRQRQIKLGKSQAEKGALEVSCKLKQKWHGVADKESLDRIAELDAEITKLSKTKEESNRSRFIGGLTKVEEDNAAFETLSQRLAAIKAEVRRMLADRFLAANATTEERNGVVSRRAANKKACRAAAVDSMGSDKAAAAFGSFIGPKLDQAGAAGVRALVEGNFAADLRLGNGGKPNKEAWANAMDERFPMQCTEEDDPERYDKEKPGIPWYQRPVVSFGDAQEIVVAVYNFKIGFQARDLQIRQDLGPGVSDVAVAAAVPGDVEATLQGISCSAQYAGEGSEDKPPALPHRA